MVKKMLFLILLFIVLFVFGIIAFVNLAPQFGAGLSSEQKIAYEKLAHFSKGKFLNKEAVDMKFSWEKMGKMMKAMSNADPNSKPMEKLKIQDASKGFLSPEDTTTRITWLGHSTVLIEIEGRKLLIDPVFGQRTSPISFIGGKRFYEDMPVSIDNLPHIDAIFISHDHYDHLDYKAIQSLTKITDRFYVPLGIGNHIQSWGVPKEKIITADWWDEFNWDELKFVFIPSRHFSGRGLNNRFSTLWGGWIFAGSKKKIFYSGDGGYGSHFKKIGEQYGPFDIGLMECGQYNENWSDVHMMPEETVQAAIDVKTDLILPVHWGAFTLAPHSWIDPIERITAKAKEMNIRVASPEIGQSLILESLDYPHNAWWRQYALKEK